MSSTPNLRASEPNDGLPPDEIIFGQTAEMQTLRDRLLRTAEANVPVLIEGESGTGKEILARLLHQRSPLSGSKFVKITCPAIPVTLLESELFGYEKGAFTGAFGAKRGRVELAHRGTLFLDEIGELEPSTQAKLLQFLQDGQFSRIGAESDTQVQVRLICATNRDLHEEVALGNFRQDLFYRIHVVNLRVTPLRERRIDIPELANHFLTDYRVKFNSRAPEFSSRMMDLMVSCDWPGNIRELENLVKRYVILSSENAVIGDLLNARNEVMDTEIAVGEKISLKKVTKRAVRELERKIILRVLEANSWNRKKAARMLSISYRALLYKLKEAGVPSQRMWEAPPPMEKTYVPEPGND